MKKEKWVLPIVIIGVIIVLWFTGIIPKQIAKVAGTDYVNENFPKMQLKCVGVEWAAVYGDYLITFKGTNEDTYSCVIGPKYFPISMGQGLFAIESDYEAKYTIKPTTIVQIIEENSNTAESSYRVGAAFPGTDFSSVGQTLADKIAQEWETHDGMTKEAIMLSSHLWGVVYIGADTWDECENAIGFSINNPLESLDWLNKTGYFGMESTDPGMPAQHIQATANAPAIGKLSEISVTAGYNTENVRITLTATLSAGADTYTTGCVYNGYATYEQNTVTTGSGIPVLVVITNGTNNAGYYNGNYYDPTAYWVKDNVFYTLRVFGDAADKAEIQDALDRILAEI